ncbi:hypothetical protein EV702DRAFT_1045741 [Suillus placidus]|uniref:Uncharacterized protein n=1 Tax=Suillus placidus TaxID=48579 RepID=A0A9P6ZUM5_9AGAM|nr:hypothetical protein EV702DRAFT_1045741 [Suillus placidus]
MFAIPPDGVSWYRSEPDPGFASHGAEVKVLLQLWMNGVEAKQSLPSLRKPKDSKYVRRANKHHVLTPTVSSARWEVHALEADCWNLARLEEHIYFLQKVPSIRLRDTIFAFPKEQPRGSERSVTYGFRPFTSTSRAGLVGLVAALTLLQNDIPVRIIYKDPNSHIGQHDPGIWARDVGTSERLSASSAHRTYLSDTIPHLQDDRPNVVLPSHLEKFLMLYRDGFRKVGVLKTFNTKRMIGIDGAKVRCGQMQQDEIEFGFTGIVRKQLGLTFLTETRDDVQVFAGDIRLKSVGLYRVHRFVNFGELSMVLRPTDEVANGWKFYLRHRTRPDEDRSDEELVFEIIASLIPTKVTFNKLIWASEFRYEQDGNLRSSKGLANKYLLEIYNVIFEMLEMTTSILNQATTTGDMPIRRNSILMLATSFSMSLQLIQESRSIMMYTGCLTTGIWRLGTGRLMLPMCSKTVVSQCCVRAQSRRWATLILGALEACDKHVVCTVVVLPSSASVTPVASSADLVFVDQESYAYSAYVVEVSQTKVFVMRVDGVIGAIVRRLEEISLEKICRDYEKFFHRRLVIHAYLKCQVSSSFGRKRFRVARSLREEEADSLRKSPTVWTLVPVSQVARGGGAEHERVG